jgi:hypothetical protein
VQCHAPSGARTGQRPAHFLVRSRDTTPPRALTFRCALVTIPLTPPPGRRAQVEYRPGSLGADELASVVVASPSAGRVEYAVRGRGLMPAAGGGSGAAAAAEVVATLGQEATRVRGCAALPAGACGKRGAWPPNHVAARNRCRSFGGGATTAWQACGSSLHPLPCPPAPAHTHEHTRTHTHTHTHTNTPKHTHTHTHAHAHTHQVLSWTNPLDVPAVVAVSLACTAGEPPGALSVAVRGAAPQLPAADGQQQPQAAGQQGGPAAGQPARLPSARCGSGAAATVPAGGAPAVVSVPPGAALQLPVTFRPAVLREADAQLAVELLEPGLGAAEAPVWRFPIRCVAQADTRGVTFS